MAPPSGSTPVKHHQFAVQETLAIVCLVANIGVMEDIQFLMRKDSHRNTKKINVSLILVAIHAAAIEGHNYSCMPSVRHASLPHLSLPFDKTKVALVGWVGTQL